MLQTKRLGHNNKLSFKTELFNRLLINGLVFYVFHLINNN